MAIDGWNKALVEAVLKSKFSPSSLNGEDIDGSFTQKYVYALTDAVAASQDFAGRYNSFNRAIAEGDAEEALSSLERLGRIQTNLYEDAIYNYSAYRLANLEGDIHGQRRSLSQAISYADTTDNNRTSFLPEEF